jgi:nitrogen fixation NifU-like protein
MDLEILYRELILEHQRSRNGRVENLQSEAAVHHVNPNCGDEITLMAEIIDGKVHIRYENIGCSISSASASVMFDLCESQSVSNVLKIEEAFLELMQSKGQGIVEDEVLGDAVAFEGVSQFPARIKCALLPYMALKDAIGRQA